MKRGDWYAMAVHLGKGRIGKVKIQAGMWDDLWTGEGKGDVDGRFIKKVLAVPGLRLQKHWKKFEIDFPSEDQNYLVIVSDHFDMNIQVIPGIKFQGEYLRSFWEPRD